ncbi:hypothetical protein [Hyalangium rubrum]|uniref:Lipoprotein n=1 Tax=Hyalangium rubrum TaxID=3103134 RepID=A0ABU5HBQ6_9BACT|nr:hypothetical protein [Hyalangium sp. s54d21]MDY7230529.1 hypothetical protein [Hyalangium sp. s54d21]
MKSAVRRYPWMAACVVALMACSKAEISDVTPGAANVGAAEVWITLTFKELPQEGDPTDVELTLDSTVLGDQIVMSWADIAERDVIALGDFKGHAINTETTGDQPPPLGTPIKFRITLPYREEVKVKNTDDLMLHLSLSWAGKREDSDKEPIGHLYELGRAGER